MRRLIAHLSKRPFRCIQSLNTTIVLKKFKTPQEKKSWSYLKDTRNVYGENDKSSRKSIPFRKKWVNRTYRKAVNQIIGRLTEINELDSNETQDKTKAIKRIYWKKSPDKPLGELLIEKGRKKK